MSLGMPLVREGDVVVPWMRPSASRSSVNHFFFTVFQVADMYHPVHNYPFTLLNSLLY